MGEKWLTQGATLGRVLKKSSVGGDDWDDN